MKKHLLTAITLFCGSLSLSAQIPTNGLVAKYSFNNGNANDEVGTNNGVVNNALPTADRFNNSSKAFIFDGTNSNYIAIPHNAVLKTDTITISLWAKYDFAIGGNIHRAIYCTPNVAASSFYISNGILVNCNTNQYLVGSQNSSTQSQMFYTSTQTGNTWHHLVFMLSNTIDLYIDGVLSQSIAKSFNTSYTSDSVYIGKTGNSSAFALPFIGSIDDIRIYNLKLTNTEITQLFNETNPITTSVDETQMENKLINVYPNPTNSTLNIEVKEQTQITIVNVLGDVVLTQTLNRLSKIDVSNLTSGVYFIQDSKSGKAIKFIKE